MHTLLFLHVFCFIFFFYNALESYPDPYVSLDKTGSSKTIEEDLERLNADIK